MKSVKKGRNERKKAKKTCTGIKRHGHNSTEAAAVSRAALRVGEWWWGDSFQRHHSSLF